jgi:Fic family protein
LLAKGERATATGFYFSPMLEKRKSTAHADEHNMSDPAEGNSDRALHGARGFAMQERRRLIRSLVESQAQCSVADLARRFDVSAVTIRSDLAALADSGALVRVHGGALPPGEGEEVPINIKQTL